MRVLACVCLSLPGQEEVMSPSRNPACDVLPLSQNPPRLIHEPSALQRERGA